MFYTRTNKPEEKPERNSGEVKVETAGYIPAKNQIENLILAGKRLENYRKEAYDFSHEEKIDESFYDPTRNPNFDLADASAIATKVDENLSESKRRVSAEKARLAEEEAEKAAIEAKEFEEWKNQKGSE